MVVADRFGVPRAGAALDQVRAAVEAWPDLAREAGVPVASQVARDFRLI
jgi:hypothetical protein